MCIGIGIYDHFLVFTKVKTFRGKGVVLKGKQILRFKLSELNKRNIKIRTKTWKTLKRKKMKVDKNVRKFRKIILLN